MITTLRALRMRRLALAVAMGASLTGCTLEGQNAPGLTGPSEFGLSLTAAASPDQLLRDGAAQSTVTITARGPDGAPLAGQRIAIEVVSSSGAVRADLVTVSADVVTAGSDGRATFAVVAPPRSSTGDLITFSMRPLGSNAADTSPRNFAIGVYPSNAAAPSIPAGPLGPASAKVGEPVVFDASGVTDEGVACHQVGCTFAWDFGDGTNGEGMTVTKAYSRSGRFVVTLTVRDRFGAESIRTHIIEVTDLTPAVITVSPNPPVVNQAATFTVALTVPPGVTVDHYEWNWGDGSSVQSTTAPTATHTYTNTDARTVTVTVVGSGGTTLSVGILSFVPETP
jgi:hypothetical protein